jgi:hypothetical protein
VYIGTPPELTTPIRKNRHHYLWILPDKRLMQQSQYMTLDATGETMVKDVEDVVDVYGAASIEVLGDVPDEMGGLDEEAHDDHHQPPPPQAPSSHGGLGGGLVQVILPLEEFAEDLDCRLGRANGNIFHRRDGIENVHDGQVMVRLKKKRFIVIDYSIIPTEDDLRMASVTPQISCPPGAGQQKCVQAGCAKVGVPVLLYDSDPAEPPSLYLRSGLCFSCQRNLNEKRRTQRKRTSTGSATGGGGGTGSNHAAMSSSEAMMLGGSPSMMMMTPGGINSNGMASSSSMMMMGGGGGYLHPFPLMDSSLIYAMGPGTKRFKLNNGDNTVIELHSEAIILNKPPIDEEGRNAYTHRDGYGFPEIGVDLLSTCRDAATDTELLIQAVSSATTTSSTEEEEDAATTAADLAGVVAAVAASTAEQEDVTAAQAAGVDAALTTTTTTTGSSGDISVLYEKAMTSLSKSMYLLTQWKQSWDAAIAAAVAHESAVVSSADLADAVASAAAVAAAAGEDASSNSMASLLLTAADQRKDGSGNHNKDSVTANVETFEV